MQTIHQWMDNKKSYTVMSFILGLLSANNIFYVFVIGTTPILLISVYAVLCLSYLFLSKPSLVNNALKTIPHSLWAFLLCTLLSVIMVILFNASYLYQWTVGIVYLFLYSIVILLVVALKDNVHSIINGILAGVFINALFVVFAFIVYKSGSIFTLHDVFPAWNMPVQLPYNNFRGWGLFLEPGHLMRYIAIMTLVVYFGIGQSRKIVKVMFIVSVAIIVIFTISSAIAIFAVGLIIFSLLVGKRDIKKASCILLFAMLGFLILFILSKTTSVGAEIWNYFVNGLFNITESDTSSEIRTMGIKRGLKIVKEYPIIGCGWNIFTKLFQEFGFYTQDVRGSYSALLDLIGELGIGAFTYIFFIFSNIVRNMKSKSTSFIAMGCASLIYFALFTLTDYSINGDCAVFIGLIIVYGAHDKQKLDNLE